MLGIVRQSRYPRRATRGRTTREDHRYHFGLVCLAVAGAYFMPPAGPPPQFFPGYEAGSDHVHTKHALAALAAGIVLFIIAWFAGRSRTA